MIYRLQDLPDLMTESSERPLPAPPRPKLPPPLPYLPSTLKNSLGETNGDLSKAHQLDRDSGFGIGAMPAVLRVEEAPVLRDGLRKLSGDGSALAPAIQLADRPARKSRVDGLNNLQALKLFLTRQWDGEL